MSSELLGLQLRLKKLYCSCSSTPYRCTKRGSNTFSSLDRSFHLEFAVFYSRMCLF